MSRSKRNFSPEFREEAVKMVIETSRPIAQVARELGVNPGTLANWVHAYRQEHAHVMRQVGTRKALRRKSRNGFTADSVAI